MPLASPKPCCKPGCPNLTHERFCDGCRKKHYAEQDAHRDRPRVYGAVWRRLRAMVLAEEPLCRECMKRGKVVAATEVHHVVATARGGTDECSNLEPLCKPCHSAETMKEANRVTDKTT